MVNWHLSSRGMSEKSCTVIWWLFVLVGVCWYSANCLRKGSYIYSIWKMGVQALQHSQQFLIFLTLPIKIGDLLDFNLDENSSPGQSQNGCQSGLARLKRTLKQFNFTGGWGSQMKASLWLQKSLKGKETLRTISILFLFFSLLRLLK